ncbi:MAG: hypothetical protein R3A44_11715 [Caldilineaceae bacterium]
MRIPADAVIQREKLTHYLLVPKPRNDKAGYLAQIGFTEHNPERLEAALRRLTDENEALLDREDEYGRFYRVEGDIQGPHGTLSTITIWIEQRVDGLFRFVTLKPARRRQ